LVLYADVLLAINFSMDFLSLFLCSIFLHLKIRRLRMILSSLFGAFYALIQMLVDLNGALTVLCSFIVAIIMIVIAFSYNSVKRTAICAVVYFFVSSVLGGIMSLLYTALNSILSGFIKSYSYEQAYNVARLWIVVSLTAIISVVFSKILVSKKDVKNAELTVTIGTEKYELSGLLDSGNLLKDPLTGRCVILVSEKSNVGSQIEKIDDIYKRYIPYSDINGEGLLKGVIPKEYLLTEEA